MKNCLNCIVLISILLVFNSCLYVHHPDLPGEDQDIKDYEVTTLSRITLLQHDLTDLGKDINEDEAHLIAETAILYSRSLAREYRLTKPPLVHNVLVHLGFRDRGLCIHWTEDLLEKLLHLKQNSFDIHWGLAYHKSLIGRDHSSVVITARGQAFEDGMVLDPWRDSGELFWIPVREDSYPWKHEAEEGFGNTADLRGLYREKETR